MKRIIAVLLAVVLVISGLGSVAYAQDPVSGVELGFHTSWIYQPPGGTSLPKARRKLLARGSGLQHLLKAQSQF